MKEIEINFRIKSWNGRPKITSTEKTQVDPDDLIVKIKGQGNRKIKQCKTSNNNTCCSIYHTDSNGNHT